MYLRAKLLNKLAPGLVPLLGVLSTGAWAEEAQRWQVNMVPGVTEIGQQVYDLHMLIFWICVWTGVGVFGFMFYSLIAYRKSKGHKPSNFHENTTAELAWTIVPAIILIAMAIPASKTLIQIYDTSEADLDVLITGYQWKWKYEYIGKEGEKVSFFSNLRTPRDEINNEEAKGEHYLLEVDNPLVLPVNKKTRLLLTANDVIHSWWVPVLSVKKDAIPGFINEAWTKPVKTGVYRGQCAELCGRDHGFMPVVVNVVEQDEFDRWFAEKQAEVAEFNKVYGETKTLAELAELGEKIHQRSCAACHGMQGEGGVGKAIAGSAIVTGELAGHLNVVVNGVSGTAMQAFGGQLNDLELAAVVTYQRNAFGNNMGDAVQAIDVKNFKDGN
ncbi:MAG TPA: cytochrome c oxidase subunit II [Pseudomonadales bacterium]